MSGYQLIDTSSDGCCVRKSSYTITEVLKKVLNLVDTAVLLICIVGIDIGLIMVDNNKTAILLLVPALYVLVSMVFMVRDVNYAFDHLHDEKIEEDEAEAEAEAADEEDEDEADEEDEDEEDMPPLIDMNDSLCNLNTFTFTYNSNEKVLAQLQKVVDETNVRNMWRRGELKVD